MANRKKPAGGKNSISRTIKKSSTPWLKNVIKSIGLTADEIFEDISPNLHDITKTSTKSVNELSKMVRGTGKGAMLTNAVKQNRYVKAIQDGLKYSIEDLKSGNINNTQRIEDVMMEKMGFNEDMLNPDTLFDDWGDFGEDGDTNVQVNNFQQDTGTAGMSIAIDEGFRQSTEANLRGHKANVDTMVAISSAQMLQQHELNNQIISGLGNINNSISALVEFNSNTMTNFIEAATAFMESMGKKSEEDNSYSYGDDKQNIDSIYRDSNGGINTENYMKFVQENIKKYYKSSTVGFIDDMLKDNIDMMITNPLGMVSKAIMTKAIPKIMTDSMKQIDEAVAGFIPSFLSRLADMDNGFALNMKDSIKQGIGKIFGLKVKRTKEFNFENKITDKEVPFDQIARHSIVEVIPKYLREQSAYLEEIANMMGVNTAEARDNAKLFNYQSGRYLTQKQAREEIYGNIREAGNYRLASSSFGSKLREYMPMSNEGDIDVTTAMMDDFFDALEKHNGIVNDPKNLAAGSDMRKIIDRLDYDDNHKNMLIAALNNTFKDRSKALNVNAAIQQARNARNQTIRNIENDPTAYNLMSIDLEQSIDRGVANTFNKNKNQVVPGARKGTNGSVSDILGDIRRLLDRGINVRVMKGKAFASIDGGAREGETSTIVSTQGKRKRRKPKWAKKSDDEAAAAGKNTTTELGESIFNKERSVEEWEKYLDEDTSFYHSLNDDKEADIVKHIKEGLYSLAFGNGAEMFASLVNVVSGELTNLGEKLNEHFWQPMKNTIFGQKDADGYSKDGLFSGVQNKLMDTYRHFNREITGKGYTDSKGNKIANKTDDEESVASNLKKFTTEIKNDVGDFILGERQFDENGKFIGRDRKKGNWIGKAIGALDEGFQGWKTAIFGEDDERDTKTTLADIKKKVSDALPSVVTGGLGGLVFGALSGGSLLGTLIGGPIGGAVMGGIGGILSRSEKFKTWLFGEEDQDNGLIPKKVQQFFKDNKIPIIGGAVLGGAKSLITGGGLLSSIVGGPIAGAIVGGTMGVISKSKMMEKFLYGDEKEGGWHKGVVNMFNNIFKKNDGTEEGGTSGFKLLGMSAIGALGGAMTAGMVGSMGLLGAALTPFGPIGGALAGLALSIKASKRGFHDWLFGKEYTDENGNKAKKAGILQRFGNMLDVELFGPMKTGILNFADDTRNFIIDRVMAPVEFALEPLTYGVKNIITGITDRISKFMKNTGDFIKKNAIDPVVNVVRDFIVKPIKSVFGFLFKAVTGIAKTVISTPFQALALMTNFMDARNKRKSRKQVMSENRERGLAGFMDNWKIRLHIGDAREDANYEYLGYDDRDDRRARYKEERKERLKETKRARKERRNRDYNRRLIERMTDHTLKEDTDENRMIAQQMYDAKHPIKGLVKNLHFKGEATDNKVIKTNEASNDTLLKNADNPKAATENRILGQIIRIVNILQGKKSDDRRPGDDHKIKRNQAQPETEKAGTPKDLMNDLVIGSIRAAGEDESLVDETIKGMDNVLKSTATGFMDKFFRATDAVEEKKNKVTSTIKDVKEGVGGLKDKILSKLPKFAGGGTTPGGAIIVGEEGPEVARLPEGTNITPNDKPINAIISDFVGKAKEGISQIVDTESIVRSIMGVKNSVENLGDQMDNSVASPTKEEHENLNKTLSAGDIFKQALHPDKPEEKNQVLKQETENKDDYEDLKKKGSYAEQDAERKRNKKEEEEQMYRNHMMNTVTEIKENNNVFKNLWASIFSKKGLITGGLLLLLPAIFRFLKNGGLGNIPEIVGEFLGKHGKQAWEDYQYGHDNMTNDETTGQRIQNQISEAQKLVQTGDVMGWIAPDGELDNMSGAKAKMLMHVPSIIGKSGIGKAAKSIGKAAVGVGKEVVGGTMMHGMNAFKAGKDAVNLASDAMTIAKNGGVKEFLGNMRSLKGAEFGADTWKAAANQAADIGGFTLKSTADDAGKVMAKNSDEALKVAKGALGKLFGKITDLIKKYGGKVGQKLPSFLDNILKAIGAKIGKFTTGLAKIMASVGAKVATVVGWVVSTAGQVTLGAINGLSGPERLFRVDKADGWMRIISTAIGAFSGTDIGAILDLINEIVTEVTGLDVFHEIACMAYDILAGGEKYEKLLQAKADFETKYDEAKDLELKPQYAQYLQDNGLTEETFTFEQYKQEIEAGNIKAETTSFATFNDQMHQTLGSRVLGGVTKAWNGIKNSGISNTIVTGAKNIGHGIVSGVKTIGSGIVNFGKGTFDIAKAIGTGYLQIKKYALTGNMESMLKYEPSLEDDNPLKDIVKGGMFIAKIMHFPPAMLTTVGRKIFETIDTYIKSYDQITAAGTENWNNIVSIAREGRFMDAFKADVSVPEGTPFSGFIKATSHIGKIFAVPTGMIKYAGDNIAQGVQDAIEGGKNLVDNIKENYNQYKGYMENGELGKMLTHKNRGETEGVFSFASGFIDAIQKIGFFLPTAFKAISVPVVETIQTAWTNTKDFASNIKNYVKKANEYTDPKKNIDGFNKLVFSSSNDPMSKITGGFLHGIMSVWVNIVRAVRSVVDTVHDVITDPLGTLKKFLNGLGGKGGTTTTTTGGRGVSQKKHGGKGGKEIDLPYFSQHDPKWESYQYGDETMGDAGCGPSAMSMVVGGLRDRTISPVNLANYAKQKGYRDESGTNWNFIDSAAKDYGLESSKTTNPDKSFVESSIKQGKPVILSGQGDSETPYTDEGHYVVATGLDSNGNVKISDPRGKNYSKSYPINDVVNHAHAGWSFSSTGARGTSKKPSRHIKDTVSMVKQSGMKLRGGFGEVFAGMNETESQKIVQSTKASNDPDMLNNFPYLMQGDGRWGSIQYSSTGSAKQTIASSGCGPTSMAMVLRSFGINITPKETCEFSLAHGCRTANSGTSHDFFGKIASSYGLTCVELGNDADAMSKALDNKWPVIASMDKGTFTKGGHFIVLCGKDTNGNIVVNDPAHKDLCHAWPISTFKREAKKYWAFHKNGKGTIGNPIPADKIALGSMGSTQTNITTQTEGAPTDVFSIVTSFFSQFAQKAWNGLLTGVWDTNYSWDDTSNSTTSGDFTNYSAMDVNAGDTETAVWKYFRNNGFTKEATAGVMGNIYQESKFNPAMIQGNGKGPAAGLFQWENYNTKSKRWKELDNLAQQRGVPWTDLGTQLDHAMNEMSNTEKWMWSKSTTDVNAGSLEGMKAMDNVENATKAFEGHFERAGKPAMQTRIEAALGYYNKYKDNDGNTMATSTDVDLRPNSSKTKGDIPSNVAPYMSNLPEDVQAAIKGENISVNTSNNILGYTSADNLTGDQVIAKARERYFADKLGLTNNEVGAIFSNENKKGNNAPTTLTERDVIRLLFNADENHLTDQEVNKLWMERKHDPNYMIKNAVSSTVKGVGVSNSVYTSHTANNVGSASNSLSSMDVARNPVMTGGKGGTEDNASGEPTKVSGPSTRFAEVNSDIFGEAEEMANKAIASFKTDDRLPVEATSRGGFGGGRGTNEAVIVDLLHAITGFLEKISDSTMSSDQKLNMLQNIKNTSTTQVNVVEGGRGDKRPVTPIIINKGNEQVVSGTNRNVDIAKRLAHGF